VGDAESGESAQRIGQAPRQPRGRRHPVCPVTPARSGKRTRRAQLRASVAGSRPTASQAASTVARTGANPSGRLPNQAYQAFQLSAARNSDALEALPDADGAADDGAATPTKRRPAPVPASLGHRYGSSPRRVGAQLPLVGLGDQAHRPELGLHDRLLRASRRNCPRTTPPADCILDPLRRVEVGHEVAPALSRSRRA